MLANSGARAGDRVRTSPTVALVSDRSLVADAVAAALTGSDLAIVRISWPGAGAGAPAAPPDDPGRPSLGLMICDLEPPTTRVARWVIQAYPTRWLVLTDTSKGPLWGAVLELGAVGVLPSTTGLADLLETVASVRAGGDALPPEADQLVADWRRDEAERTAAHSRMGALTPREAEVLRQLHLGRSVHDIARLNGVARSTVRSQVRSVLRKLGVSSQLAASAMLERWGEPTNR